MMIEDSKMLIEKLFKNPFNSFQYKKFLNDLLGSFEDSVNDLEIDNRFKNHVKSFKRIGYCDILSRKTSRIPERLDLLVVKLKSQRFLDGRPGILRNLIIGYLSNIGVNNALVVFCPVAAEEGDWRFSFIQARIVRKGNKFSKEFTDAKRSSFLVGRNEPNLTARNQLGELLAKKRRLSIEDFNEAFSVSKVSEDFYLEYFNIYNVLQKEIKGFVASNNSVRKEFKTRGIKEEDFTKRLMAQIVFLFFVQKKGWLGSKNNTPWDSGPRDFLQNLYDSGGYSNFYSEILEPLFYEGLSSERHENYYDALDCRIPFLGGGLFEPLNSYDWGFCRIFIENQTIERVLKTFSKYNFTVREDDPNDRDVAVDPEMLGKIFENMLPENVKKKAGVCYTPREIVKHIAQNSLADYLSTRCSKTKKENLLNWIRDLSLILEVEKQQAKQDFFYSEIFENAKHLDELMRDVKICDPAIGSGAFQIGVLSEIVKIREALGFYLDEDRKVYSLKMHAIEKSLYGVDLDPGAVEIAKLRLWLSLVIDQKNPNQIKVLPNLDYRIMTGNSLVDDFQGMHLDFQNDTERNIFQGNTFRNLVKEINKMQQDFFQIQSSNKKKRLKKLINLKIIELFTLQLQNEGKYTSEVKKILQNMMDNSKEKTFFPWKLYFSDVFDDGGFDIMIGNPPYIEEGKNRKAFDGTRTSPYYQGKMNLTNLFVCRGIDFLKDGGILSFIAKNNWVTQAGASKMRKKVIEETRILQLIDFRDFMVFDRGIQTMIMVFRKDRDSDDYEFDYRSLLPGREDSDMHNLLCQNQKENNEMFYPKVRRADFSNSYLVFNNPEIESILDKVKNFDNFKLGQGEVCQGIVPNPDRLGKKNIKSLKNPEKFEINEGVFVVPKNHFSVLSIAEKKYIKPLYGPTEVDRYLIRENKNEIIYIKKSNYKNDAPNLINHLQAYREIMDQRRENKTGQLDFFHLHWPRDEDFFLEGEKILSVRKCKKPIFSFTCKPAYVLMTFNVIKTENVNQVFLTGFLNSSICAYWLRYKGKMQGGHYQIDKVPLLNIPVPNVSKETEAKMIDLVKQIINKKKENLQNDVTGLETEIDKLVYKLYDLTDKEIQIVELSQEV